jgi:hypothetical protein
VFEFSLSNPSAVDTTYTLHSPMELEVLITLPLRKTTVPAGATTGTGATTADTIDENNETFHCLWNGFGYWNNQ